MAEDEVTERKSETSERRVYTLPASLLERLRAFQVAQGLSSEAEAVRRLIDTGLQLRDTVDDILNTLGSKFAEERDLRVLASEFLTKHILVQRIDINDGCVDFYLRDNERGRITQKGNLYYGSGEFNDDIWREYKKPAKVGIVVTAPAKGAAGGPSWEPAGGDLDDEIPF